MKLTMRKLLEILAILIFIFGKASSIKTTQCGNRRIYLECPENHVIEIQSIWLGDSWCSTYNCCPSSTNCGAKASDKHLAMVYVFCNNNRRCSYDVAYEWIYCSIFPSNDYETVTWDCINTEAITNTANTTNITTIATTFTLSNTNTTIIVTSTIAVFIFVIVLVIIIALIIIRRLKGRRLTITRVNGLFTRPISFKNLKLRAYKNETSEGVKEPTDFDVENEYATLNEVASQKQKFEGKDEECCGDVVFKNGHCKVATISKGRLLGFKDKCLRQLRISNIYSNPQEMNAARKNEDNVENSHVVP